MFSLTSTWSRSFNKITTRCKMKNRHISSVVVCIHAIITSLNGNNDETLEIRHPKRTNYDYFVRCTRRFTPGLCIEPVKSVWTFVFQLQNCTERYGCRQDWRTNRFTTYARCMTRCKPLVDFYTEILARDSQNLSAYIRSQPWNKSGRRDTGDDDDSTDYEEDDYDPEIKDNLNGPAPILSDDPVDHNDWAVTVDIDDVVVENIENDGFNDRDLFHHD